MTAIKTVMTNANCLQSAEAVKDNSANNPHGQDAKTAPRRQHRQALPADEHATSTLKNLRKVQKQQSPNTETRWTFPNTERRFVFANTEKRWTLPNAGSAKLPNQAKAELWAKMKAELQEERRAFDYFPNTGNSHLRPQVRFTMPNTETRFTLPYLGRFKADFKNPFLKMNYNASIPDNISAWLDLLQQKKLSKPFVKDFSAVFGNIAVNGPKQFAHTKPIYVQPMTYSEINAMDHLNFSFQYFKNNFNKFVDKNFSY